MGVASWRMVVKRMRSDGLIVVAATVTIVLAVVLLAAGPIYADAVTVAGAQRKLIDAPVSDASITISQRVGGEDYPATNELVSAEAGDLLAPLGGEIVRLGQSEPYRLPDDVLEHIGSATPPDDDRTRQTLFEFYDGIESHAELVEGRWPAPSGDVVEVVLPEQAIELLGLAPGDEFEVVNRLNANVSLNARIVGIYRVNDGDDPFWYGDALPVEGIDPGQSVVVIGPLVTDPETFVSAIMIQLSTVEWRVLPDYGALELDDVAPLRGSVRRLPDRLELRQEAGTPFQVTSGLTPLLAEVDRGLLAARSGVFILTLQLAILAGYALVLTANLLTEVRSVEMALLRSRGAGVWQVAGFSLLEGLLLVGPAVAAGPWLAAQSLRLLNVAGPLAGIGLNLEPQVSRLSYIFAGMAGLGCLLVLVIPSLLAARSILGARAARGREGERPLLQRAGVDLALVGVAGLGFFQLRRFGSPLTETVRGRLELDPLLIAAPALGLLAGAVLALRLIPLLGRLAEQVSSRGNRLVAALGSWQVSRRPGRYARSALLLMLALGIGLFAVSFSRTWNDSQADQADYQVGADVVVRPDRTDRSAPVEYLGGAYEGLDGVASAMPVTTGVINIPTSSGSARTVFLDSARAAEIVAVRDDFARDGLPELMAPLADARPEIQGIPVPGEPRRIALDVRSTMTRICTEPELVRDDVGAPGVHTYETYSCQEHADFSPALLRRFDAPLSFSMVIYDARGAFYRFTTGRLESSEEVQRVVFDLSAESSFLPQFPIQIVEFELRTLQAPQPLMKTGTFNLLGISASEQADGEDWTVVEAPASEDDWELNASPPSGNVLAGAQPLLRFGILSSGGPLDLDFDAGSGFVPRGFSTTTPIPVQVELSARLRQPELSQAIPIILSEELLVEIAFSGDAQFRLLLGGAERLVSISGALRSFPSIAPDDDLIIVVDGPTIGALQFIESGRIDSQFDSWWLAVDGGASDDVAATLEEAPFISNDVETRAGRARELRTDPVALGTLGALTLGFVAAVVFAIVGFVSSAVVGARERMTEFALLRAIGLSSRQLAGWLLVENGFLVVLSLLGGTLLGFLLSWLILPLITVNREAEQVFPSLIVIIPWRTILVLEAVILLLLLVVSAVMALVLRRVGLGTALRIGEE